eukprot:TRINITY_DN351_c0_g1_i4.p1 TRINITY_DN351_c0_g1~~TRINITY_DN351_c0_g1_i4.p1  ORF type:complete len:826 (-),score=212.49 TRINITY_DN351_c0_g1_i4:28-2331(-)
MSTFHTLVSDMVSSRSITGIPSTFSFHPTAPIIYFLGTKTGTASSSLYLIDSSSASASSSSSSLVDWQSFVEINAKAGELSKEELLLRERMRMVANGITSYHLTKSGHLLLPSPGQLHLGDVLSSPTSPTFRSLDPCNVQGSRLDPKLSPDGKFLSFVQNGNLFIQPLDHEAEDTVAVETQCTFSDRVTLTYGVAEFNVQEEFDRYTGYWWSPSCDRMAYLMVDEQQVEEYAIPKVGHDGEADVSRYPEAGKPNAINDLKMGVLNDNGEFQQYSLATPLKESFEWMEYVVRCGWTFDGQAIWAQLLDRLQGTTAFVLFPLDCFVSDADGEDATDGAASPVVLIQESSDVWINVNHIFHCTQDNRFIYASESTGYRHLYSIDFSDLDNVGAPVPITAGDGWQVCDSAFAVDQINNWVYFVATKDSVLRNQLYGAPMDGSCQMHLLTDASFDHSISLKEDGTQFVSTFSNISSEPVTQLFDIVVEGDGVQSNLVCTLNNNIQKREPTMFQVNEPVLFSFQNENGDTCHGRYFLPNGYKQGEKYPTLVYMYGGPHVQLVRDTFQWGRNMRLHMYAHLGYLVVTIDGRGSWNRGLEFEGHLKHAMGQFELDDQITGLKYLANEVGILDLERIAINGWSYGGYMSLMAMAQHAEFFKCAISGAPVTRWELYDTGYTERYMGLPEEQKEAYELGSVMHYVDGFPEQSGRLMIVHGLIDENVHFQHTAELLMELNANGKWYDLVLFPDERHGTRKPKNAGYYDVRTLTWLKENL